MAEEDRAVREIFGAIGGLLKICYVVIRFAFRLIFGIFYVTKQIREDNRFATVQKFTINTERRFAHTHMVAGSGHGKTQAIQHMIAALDQHMIAALDWEALKKGERTVIVMDSQGDMIRTILHLADLSASHPNSIANRLVLIDPTDTENAPCLNVFDFGQGRLKTYSGREKERLVNGTIALYEYLFGELLGAEMTHKQEPLFRYLARLLLVVPGATIYTLMDFMKEPPLIRRYLTKLEDEDPTAAQYIENEVFSANFDATRQQVRNRLWNALSTSKALERMFSHEQNKLDMFEAMNKGSLILINTAKGDMHQRACQIFGKFMIALITQATLERGVSGAKRTPTFFYIDEAQDYFDEGLELLLNQARKYNVGLILAHQNLGQLARKLSDSIMTSTAIKFAGGVSDDDAKDLAPNMGTTPEMIREMRKRPTDTRFALYVKDETTEAVEFSIPLLTLEKRPRMSDREFEQLLEDNRRRYYAPVERRRAKQTERTEGSFDLEEPPSI